MSNSIVADASVVIKWLNTDEEDHDVAKLVFEKYIPASRLVVPELCFLEVANYLATKTISSEEDVQNGMDILFDLNLITYKLTNEDLKQAAVMAKKYQTAVYDMVYAIVAQKLKIKLITADGKFAKKTGFDFVQVLQ